jgi:hypothetical protein
MCRESFGKRITTFCLSLGIGTFVSDFGVWKESPGLKKTKSSVTKEKNCVFADKNLKYERLPLEKEVYILPQVEEKPELKLIPSEKKELKKSETEIKQNNFAEPVPQLHIPSQNSAEYQTLLHKENCFESDESK